MTTPSSHSARIDVACDDPTLLVESPLTASADLAAAQRSCAQTPFALPPCPVHWLFEEQAKHTPQQIALEGRDLALTYAQLNQAADRFAGTLLNQGVQRGELVGLFIERGPQAIIAILGILKSGAAFLPLDPSYPAERIRFMLADAQPRGIVTTQNLRAVLDEHLCGETNSADLGELPHVWQIEPVKTLTAEDSVLDLAAAQRISEDVSATADDVAYAIFTSGSTGRPKAALLAHRGLRNLCVGQQAMFPVHAGSRVLQFASLCFDASISEVFVTLTCGATLCLATEAELAPSRLAQTLNKLRVSVATIPPSVLSTLAEEEFPSLRTLVTAGESCPPKVVKRFAQSHRLVNAYGPTEATVCATMHVCDAELDGPPPIGLAMPGCDVYLLNENRQECVGDETGEMYLGGIGLAIGYLNRPELTAEKFVDVELHGRDVRLYQTGDLARRRPDGVFEFVGRRDQQVKIRGVRIELGELEHALQQHPYISEAVVTTEEPVGAEADTGKRLVAHVAGGNGTPLSSSEVLSWLRTRVLPAMLPSEIHCRRTMPLLPNGKIDRKELHRATTELASEQTTTNQPKSERTCQTSSPARPSLAPRDRFELETLEAFEEILEVADIGVEDDFFLLGGDSLQAMDLLARVEAAFGVTPSMADLMRAPTVAGLANVIAQRKSPAENDQASQEWSPLVPLSPHDAAYPADARPLYCAHPGGGNALCFLDLARRLANDRPVIGLAARGLEPGQTPLASVEELADEYIAALREHQPEGPYAIAGWSFGGIVAFEMAKRLLESGEEIEHLGIIDCGFLYSFGVLTTLFPEGDLALFELQRLPAEDQIREFSKRTSHAKLIPPGANPKLARRIYDTFMANVDAMMNYRPDRYDGRMTIYRADEPLIRHRRELADEWADHCDHVEVCTVAGNHLTMIHEPSVADLANQLRERLAFR